MGDSTRITTNDLIRRVLLRRTGVLNPMEDAFTKRYWTARIIMAMHRSACVGVKSRATTIALARLRYAGILSPGSHLEDEDGTYFAAERALAYQG